jgi:hypothetical protein
MQTHTPLLQPFAAIGLFQKEIQKLRTLTATVALGCLPIATNTFAAGTGAAADTASGRVAGGSGSRALRTRRWA